VVSSVKQGVSSEDEVETGSRETPGEVWFDLMSEGLSQVATEMHEGVFQDGLGCQDCWVNPTLRRCLCSQSVYNPLYFAHCCLMTQCCSCEVCACLVLLLQMEQISCMI
jgi:hypothetical protein